MNSHRARHLRLAHGPDCGIQIEFYSHLISRLMLQVIVLSEGHQLYFGLPGEAVAWFSGSLGYAYEPAQDGAVSDWLMDLVSVGFSKRSDFGSRYAPCPPNPVWRWKLHPSHAWCTQ